MDKQRIKGSWNELVGNLKQRSARQTGDSAMYGEGQDQRVVGRLQSGIGKAKDRVRKLFG